MDKKALRRRLLEERQAIPAARRLEMSEAIVRHLAEWLRPQKADVVAIYAPTRGEPDVLELAAKKVGAVFALPVVGEQPGAMVFHAYAPGDSLFRSKLGILEPDVTRPTVPFTSQSVVVVPAVALDQTGGRLGYGGGYYDRFLKIFPGKAIGVVFSGMMVERLPVQPHDVHLPFLATEEGVTASEAP